MDLVCLWQYYANMPSIFPPQPEEMAQRTATAQGTSRPTLFRIVCGFFTIPDWTLNMEGTYCEMGSTVYSPYLKRLESLTIFRWNCKGSTLRHWVMLPLKSTVYLHHWFCCNPQYQQKWSNSLYHKLQEALLSGNFCSCSLQTLHSWGIQS